MASDCHQCRHILFTAGSDQLGSDIGIDDFEAEIHQDVPSLKACSEQRSCRLCVVLCGMLDHRERFGPSERQSSRRGLHPKICLSLHFPGYEESDAWDIIDAERHVKDAPDSVVFSHPLGTDNLRIRNPQVIARSSRGSDEAESPKSSPEEDVAEDTEDLQSTNMSTGSDESFVLARRWVDHCAQSHKNCEMRSSSTRQIPRRLLDVTRVVDKTNGLVHLVSPTERVSGGSSMWQYVTLSHRWNPTYNCFTFTSNICEHEMQGIEMAQLPKTFAEACATVKKLGLAYLWIDSLCIIQDSNADKALKIPNMADYYQNAELNLLASTQSIAGLWSDRDGEATKPFKINATLDLPEGKKQVLLELARQMSASESCPYGADLTASSKYLAVQSIIGIKLDRDCSLTIIGGIIRSVDAMGQNIGLATRRRMLKLWYAILYEYSLRELSFESDRLDAISGLAERLSPIIGDEYIGGMWKSNLLECMQWQSITRYRGREAIRQTCYRAPTWSWASCELPPRSCHSPRSKGLSVDNEYAGRNKSLAAVRVLDVKWECEGANRFGSLSEASLSVLGRPLRGFAYPSGSTLNFDEAYFTMDENIEELPALKPTREVAEMVSPMTEDTSDQKVEGVVHLLPVAEIWMVGIGDRLFCLILREISPGVFERIGSSLYRSCYVIKVPERKMVLI